MKKTLAAVGIALLAVLLSAAGCDPMSGGACSPIGKTTTDSKGQVWTCAENLKTGNGYWYKGKL